MNGDSLTMHMRPSRVLKKLRAGGTASCIKINSSCPRVVELAALAGFDCVWLDMEHVPSDWRTLESQINAAKIYDTDCMVRVARGGYSDYIRPLEADATGIMVPHVMSLADATEVVQRTRFHPIGRRPLDGGNADGRYTRLDLAEYMKTANAERFVVVQIEDPEPLDELDEIAALPGIDIILFGPGDFSQGIGAPAQWDHPLIAEARQRIAQVARAHGKFAATIGAPDACSDLFELGYRFLNIGADVVGLGNYYADAFAAFQHAARRA